MATIDTYLDELLAGDMPPRPAPAAPADAHAPRPGDVAAVAPQVDAGPVAEPTVESPPSGGIAADVVAPQVDPAAATSAAADPALARIDPDLLAELMSDPALSGAIPSDLVPARVVPAAQTPAAARTDAAQAPAVQAPPSMPSRPAVPDLSAFLPPAASPLEPVARAAVAAASASRTRTATGGHRWLRVCVGGDSYGFELLRVQEVVRVAPVLAMRGAAHSVLGVMNLRGRILPVFDLGLWLDVGAVRVDERARIVVIERNDELIGVLVTAVEDVVSLEREHVEPPLPGADPGPTLGVARVTSAPTVLLDADALFD